MEKNKLRVLLRSGGGANQMFLIFGKPFTGAAERQNG